MTEDEGRQSAIPPEVVPVPVADLEALRDAVDGDLETLRATLDGDLLDTSAVDDLANVASVVLAHLPDPDPVEGAVETIESQPLSGAELIAAERRRQVEEEGWTPEHDGEHAEGDLYEAAIAYLLALGERDQPPPDVWPWDSSWWKPTPGDEVRQLVKAGALIAAEIDRRQRADRRIRD